MRTAVSSRLLSHLPVELRTYLRRRRRRQASFDDSFTEWAAAAQASAGYASEVIVQSVLSSTLAVSRGEAVFERDSVTFDEADYSWPVLSGFMWAAAASQGHLNVLDFGGALGSTYFQNARFLEDLASLRWCIVEQPAFVETGRQHLANSTLEFYDDLQECLDRERPNLIHFGSSLQYLEDPWQVLTLAAASKAQFLIVDRTPVSRSDYDLVTVQEVPASIYPASYPARVFSSSLLRGILLQDWEIIAEFESLGGEAKTTGGVAVTWQGWLCCRRTQGG